GLQSVRRRLGARAGARRLSLAGADGRAGDRRVGDGGDVVRVGAGPAFVSVPLRVRERGVAPGGGGTADAAHTGGGAGALGGRRRVLFGGARGRTSGPQRHR